MTVFDRTFVISSLDRHPGSWFHGYAFVDADVVIGGAGATAYEAARGHGVAPGEDGCYFSLRRTGSGLVAGCDHFGYKKLFLYSETGPDPLWAMSNSLTRLADFVGDHGRRLTLHAHQLAAWGLPGSFGAQLTTFETVYAEIRLIPSTCDVVVDTTTDAPGGGVQVVRRTPAPAASYEVALHRYLSVWASRIVTLLGASTALVSDLTGGRDSRIVTALVQLAARLGHVPDDRWFVRSGQQPAHADDLRIAEHLGHALGFTVNPGGRSSVATRPIPTGAAYALWKHLDLGVYRPVYFPPRTELALSPQLGGGGGEAYRPFYPQRDPAAFARARRKEFTDPREWEAWNAAFGASVALLEEHSALDAHPMILHYREFRNRCHAGRAPQVRMVVAPLASRLLDDCARAIDPARLAANQVLFDLMASIDPRLVTLPFDSDAKAPDDANLAALTAVDVRADDLLAGEVFCAADHFHRGDDGDFVLAEAISLMREELETAAGPAVSLGVGEAVVARGREQLSVAAAAGRFAHAVAPADAVRVLLAGEVARHVSPRPARGARP